MSQVLTRALSRNRGGTSLILGATANNIIDNIVDNMHRECDGMYS
jgi:hypothetical protein